MRRSPQIAAVVGTVVLLGSGLGSQAAVWNNTSGGSYHSAANWDSANVPDTGTEVAEFNDAGLTYTVTFSGSPSPERLLVWNSSNITFNLGGNNFTLTSTTTGDTTNVQSVRIAHGTNGNATLTLTNGTMTTNQVTVGRETNQNGTLIVGSAATLNTTSDVIYVGRGTAGSPGSSATGVVTAQSGGDITSGGVELGYLSGSTGTANVTGVGSTWTTAGTMLVGRSGTGHVNITAGGLLDTTGDGRLGFNAGSTGTATVSGVGSLWEMTGLMHVGRAGHGELTISSGGVVDVTGNAMIAWLAGGTGNATVAGANSAWNIAGTHLYVAGGANPNRGASGTLAVNNGGMVTVQGGTGTVLVYGTGTLKGDGGTITGNVFNHGTVSPGNSAGILTIAGNYTQMAVAGSDPAGNLFIELGGLAVGTQYDQLVVTGNASLNGSLNVAFINSFALGANQTFHIMDVGGTLSGQFAGLGEGSVVTTNNGFDLHITYDHDTLDGVVLYTIPEPGTLALAGMGMMCMVWRKRLRP